MPRFIGHGCVCDGQIEVLHDESLVDYTIELHNRQQLYGRTRLAIHRSHDCLDLASGIWTV